MAVPGFTPAVHEMKFSPLLVAAINRNSRRRRCNARVARTNQPTKCKLVKLEMSDAAAKRLPYFKPPLPEFLTEAVVDFPKHILIHPNPFKTTTI